MCLLTIPVALAFEKVVSLLPSQGSIEEDIPSLLAGGTGHSFLQAAHCASPFHQGWFSRTSLLVYETYLRWGIFRFRKTHTLCLVPCLLVLQPSPPVVFLYPSTSLLKLFHNLTTVSLSGHETPGAIAFEAKFLHLVGSRVELPPNLLLSSLNNNSIIIIILVLGNSFRACFLVSLISSVSSHPNFSK